MHYRALGTTGFSVSAIGLGCSHLGSHWRGRTRSDMIRLLHRAMDRGINFFDTADVYMQGESEELLGAVLRAERDDVVIATKGGFLRPINESAVARLRPYVWHVTNRIPALARALTKTRRLMMRQDFSHARLCAAVENSLRRLKRDRLDLFQLHSPPSTALERDGVLETLERLRADGKIRFFGLSYAESNEARLESGIATVQLPIAPHRPAPLIELLLGARERRIGIIANQPLTKGTLLQQEARGAARVRSLAQAAIRYVCDQPGVSTVLTGTTSIAHLDENVAALEAPPLDAEELAWLCARSTGSAREPQRARP